MVGRDHGRMRLGRGCIGRDSVQGVAQFVGDFFSPEVDVDVDVDGIIDDGAARRNAAGAKIRRVNEVLEEIVIAVLQTAEESLDVGQDFRSASVGAAAGEAAGSGGGGGGRNGRSGRSGRNSGVDGTSGLIGQLNVLCLNIVVKV